MNRNCIALAVALLAMLHSAAARDLPKEMLSTPAAEDSYEQRAQQSIARRLSRAQQQFEHAKREEASDTNKTALLSFNQTISLDKVLTVIDVCRCRLLEIHRTIGETQMSWGTSTARLADLRERTQLERDFISILERSLTDIDAEVPQVEPNSAHSRWLGQKREAFAATLTKVKANGFEVNGLTVQATIADLEEIRTRFAADLLAIEFMEGTARMFAIPLQLYR